MSFVCAMDKAIPFTGRDAIAKQLDARPLGKRMVQFLLNDPEPVFYHHEPIWRDGKMIGHLTSGNYGHALGGSVGLGYVYEPDGVSKDFLDSGTFEIEVAGERIPATASLRALYDPRSERVKV